MNLLTIRNFAASFPGLSLTHVFKEDKCRIDFGFS